MYQFKSTFCPNKEYIIDIRCDVTLVLICWGVVSKLMHECAGKHRDVEKNTTGKIQLTIGFCMKFAWTLPISDSLRASSWVLITHPIGRKQQEDTNKSKTTAKTKMKRVINRNQIESPAYISSILWRLYVFTEANLPHRISPCYMQCNVTWNLLSNSERQYTDYIILYCIHRNIFYVYDR